MGRKTKTAEVGTTTICQWYVLCGDPATTTQSHPILGNVPICDRCKAIYDKLTVK